MPIIEIQALIDGDADVGAMLGEVAKAAALALGTEERYCWATFRPLASGCYYEGGRLRDADDASVASPIVRIAAYAGRPPEVKRRLLTAIAEVVGEHLGVPVASVFVEVREMAPGNVLAGGRIL